MSLATATLQSQNSKIGTCPHGLPLGACPICNGMSGGGGVSRRDTPRRAGEMSWNECAAIGAMLKAQKAERLAREAEQQQYLQALANFQKTLDVAGQRLSDLTNFISNNVPRFIAKPVNFVLNKVVGGLINAIKNLPVNITQILANITQKFADITDKLTAMVGELKAAMDKKISEAFGAVKKKLKSIFSIFNIGDIEDEDKKIEEEKRAFELKTFVHNLYEKFTKEEKDVIDES
jgi:enamine deaminase RidA (YjgF/YER057c/UK114 family)